MKYVAALVGEIEQENVEEPVVSFVGSIGNLVAVGKFVAAFVGEKSTNFDGEVVG